jgi:hypothetical protein
MAAQGFLAPNSPNRPKPNHDWVQIVENLRVAQPGQNGSNHWNWLNLQVNGVSPRLCLPVKTAVAETFLDFAALTRLQG